MKKCKICGCTEERACLGGCYWVSDNLCSSCFSRQDKKEKLLEALDLLDYLSSKCLQTDQEQIKSVNLLKSTIQKSLLMEFDTFKFFIDLLRRNGINSKLLLINILEDMSEIQV